MIPLPWITGLPWRLIGWGALVAVVGFCGWRVSAWERAYAEQPALKAALEAERTCAAGSECSARQHRYTEAVGHETQRIVVGYEAELAALRARPARVVRLCPQAGSGNVRGTSPAAGTDGAGPAAGVVHGSAGQDIGQPLYDLARDADEVAARLRALQEFSRAVSGPGK